VSKASSDSTPEGQENSVLSSEQRESLLRTKLFAPSSRTNQIARPRLLEQVSGGLDKALILVSAPAGYGKTSLISGWLRDIPIASAWLSLDEGDNDPARFLQYFVTAIQQIAPTPGQDLLNLLQAVGPVSSSAQMNVLINVIAEQAPPFALVLDDFHVIHAQPILDMLAFLLEHIPPQMHLVLLSRTDPPLPLARLRVRHQLTDIRADQLRFTSAEIAVFLNEVMGLRVSAEDMTALEARTEGWIASLQLAALSMQGRKDIHSFVSAFSGSHYYIMDYLAEEVLQLQPESIRAFLLQTSILDRMCGPLCDAVVNADSASTIDGQALLETLEQRNVFVIPLDDKRRWFRYHHLFMDVLNQRLEHQFPALLPQLHRRASLWYEQNGFMVEAVQHALKADDHDRAAQLLDQDGCFLLMSGEVVTLLNWIDAIEFQPESHPWLAIQKAWALSLIGNLDQVEPTLQVPEQLLLPLEPTVEVRTMRGTIAAARAHAANLLGDTRLAAERARQALELLPDCAAISRSMRSVATSILGDASWLNDDLEEAKRAYTEAINIGRAARNQHMVVIANSNLADILTEQGKLHQAARMYSEISDLATRPDGQRSPLAEGAYSGLSRLSYEWNHLEAVEKDIRQCLELCRQWENLDLQAVADAMLARLEHARGNPEKAQAALHAAEPFVSDDRLSPKWSSWVKSAVARLWLAQGDLERPAQLMRQSGITLAGLMREAEIPYLREPEYVVLVRVLLAQGDYDAALALSERLLPKAEIAGRVGRMIEILALQALAYQGKKGLDQALAVLGKAFALAQPEGYVRTFLDEGEPMAKLLYQAKTHGIGTGYAAKLLAALGDASGSTLPSPQLLIEPLTARELELLKLIEAGHTNQEIAAKLVISMPTVKRHISNVYTKLGASSRTQAIARGRELGFFDG
jgi:LuxR family transcriptional regulator, maltose regulon positive regulatory protein